MLVNLQLDTLNAYIMISFISSNLDICIYELTHEVGSYRKRRRTEASIKNDQEASERTTVIQEIHSRERSTAHGRLAPNADEKDARRMRMRREGRRNKKGKETTGPERSGYKNDLRLTGACRSCGEPGKTWWRRGKPREVDGWVLHPLSTGLLGHSYASAVRPISSRNGLSYITAVTSTLNFRPTFQREIYDSPSRFPVQNLAFDFFLSFLSFQHIESFDSF